MNTPDYPIMRLQDYVTAPPDGDGDEPDIMRDEDDLRTLIRDFGSAMTAGETFVDTAGQRWRIESKVEVSFTYQRVD